MPSFVPVTVSAVARLPRSLFVVCVEENWRPAPVEVVAPVLVLTPGPIITKLSMDTYSAFVTVMALPVPKVVNVAGLAWAIRDRIDPALMAVSRHVPIVT